MPAVALYHKHSHNHLPGRGLLLPFLHDAAFSNLCFRSGNRFASLALHYGPIRWGRRRKLRDVCFPPDSKEEDTVAISHQNACGKHPSSEHDPLLSTILLYPGGIAVPENAATTWWDYGFNSGIFVDPDLIPWAYFISLFRGIAPFRNEELV